MDKLCKNCVHIRFSSNLYADSVNDVSYCVRTEGTRDVDPITGYKLNTIRSAALQRKGPTTATNCGVRAGFYKDASVIQKFQNNLMCAKIKKIFKDMFV